jgi:hypothetical protein
MVAFALVTVSCRQVTVNYAAMMRTAGSHFPSRSQLVEAPNDAAIRTLIKL